MTVVVDPPLAPQLDHRVALGVEQLAPQPLVALRALLDLTVVLVVEARREAARAEAVGAAHALGRVVAHPVLAGQLLEPPERGLGRVDARLGLLLVGDPVVLEAEQADHGRAASGPARRASRGSRRTRGR